MFALFQDGKMISKPHTTRDAVAMEAYEKGLVVRMPVQVVSEMLANGVQIRDLEPRG